MSSRANLTINYVFQKLSVNEKKEIIALWVNAGVLDERSAQQRVEQVSCTILFEGHIVGVSTVYANDFTMPNNPYFFFRMFIQENYRGNNRIRKEIMQVNFHELKKAYESQVHGIVLELENEKLAKLGAKTHYMNKRGYTYYGKSPRGLQLWYVRFDDPKGIFVNPS